MVMGRGFKVANGNTWWYRITQVSWNNQYGEGTEAVASNRCSWLVGVAM